MKRNWRFIMANMLAQEAEERGKTLTIKSVGALVTKSHEDINKVEQGAANITKSIGGLKQSLSELLQELDSAPRYRAKKPSLAL
jgi:archaellum component FlaC